MIDKIYNWLHSRISRAEEWGEYSSGIWQNRVRKAALELCPLEQGRVLEIGCGEGLFLAKLVRRYPGLEAYGTDISKTLLDRARDRLARESIYTVTLSSCDGKTVPYPDEYFNVVFLINVSYNLPSREIFGQVIREMIRVCHREGHIIFDIRNGLNPLVTLKYRLARYYDATIRETNLPLRTDFLNWVTVLLRDHGCVVSLVEPLAFPRNALSPIFIIKARKIDTWLRKSFP